MEMENMIFCQSCAMPMMKDEDYGTNQDGSKNEEYCTYCYQSGAFTADITMEQMIEACVPTVSYTHLDVYKRQLFGGLRLRGRPPRPGALPAKGAGGADRPAGSAGL